MPLCKAVGLACFTVVCSWTVVVAFRFGEWLLTWLRVWCLRLTLVDAGAGVDAGGAKGVVAMLLWLC